MSKNESLAGGVDYPHSRTTFKTLICEIEVQIDINLVTRISLSLIVIYKLISMNLKRNDEGEEYINNNNRTIIIRREIETIQHHHPHHHQPLTLLLIYT